MGVLDALLEGFNPGEPRDWHGRFRIGDVVRVKGSRRSEDGDQIVGRIQRFTDDGKKAIVAPEHGGAHIEATPAQISFHDPMSATRSLKRRSNLDPKKPPEETHAEYRSDREAISQAKERRRPGGSSDVTVTISSGGASSSRPRPVGRGPGAVPSVDVPTAMRQMISRMPKRRRVQEGLELVLEDFNPGELRGPHGRWIGALKAIKPESRDFTDVGGVAVRRGGVGGRLFVTKRYLGVNRTPHETHHGSAEEAARHIEQAQRAAASGDPFKAGDKVVYKSPMGIDRQAGEIVGEPWRGYRTVREPTHGTTLKVSPKDIELDTGERRHYFSGEGDMLARVSDLTPSERQPDLERSVKVAQQRMADAKAGKMAKRGPLTVRIDNGRMVVTDGKSTLEAARRMGISHVPVNVARPAPSSSSRQRGIDQLERDRQRFARGEVARPRVRESLLDVVLEGFTVPASGPVETPAQSQARGAAQVASADKSLRAGWSSGKHPRGRGGKFAYTTGGKRATRGHHARSSSSSSSSTAPRLLNSGSRGALVQSIQRTLNVPSDGIYGPQTKAAVARYQRQHGLQVDGVVGAQTLASMRGATNARLVKPGPIPSKAARLTHPRAKKAKAPVVNRIGGGVLV